MNRTSWTVLNFVLFLLLVLLSASLQSSLFHWIIGWRPTIQLALVFLVYICLTRSQVEGLIFTITSCYCLGLLSVMYASVSVFGGLCVFILIQIIRARVYSPGPVYFTWTTLGAVITFHVITWFFSVIEVRAVTPRPLDWILEVLLTSLFVRVAYSFCIWVDTKTKRLAPSDLSS